jgi:hypothetical protein
MVLSISGTLFSIILATVLGWYITNSRTLFMILGTGLGVIAMIPPLIVFKVTWEDPAQMQADHMPMLQAIKTTLSNVPFRMVMGLYLFSWTTASILSAALIYFANYYLRVPEQANYFVLTGQGCALAFIPLWVWVAHKLDKRRAFILSMASWVVVLAGIALLRPEQTGLAYLLAALSGSGIAPAYLLPWAMIPDIIETDELKTGERREGSFYTFASFFQKLGTGVAIWALGQALALTGYINPVQGQPLPVQPPQAVQAIRWTMGRAGGFTVDRYPVCLGIPHQPRKPSPYARRAGRTVKRDLIKTAAGIALDCYNVQDHTECILNHVQFALWVKIPRDRHFNDAVFPPSGDIQYFDIKRPAGQGQVTKQILSYQAVKTLKTTLGVI